MKYKVKEKLEKLYKKVTKILPQASYQIVEPHDALAKDIGPTMDQQWVSAWVSTSDVTMVEHRCGTLIIPPGSQIIHQRIFRHCTHNGTPHLNADDMVLFPIKEGNIVGVYRKDAPDHYTSILQYGGLEHIANEYHLPKQKAGHINAYTVNGASIPIIIDFKPTNK